MTNDITSVWTCCARLPNFRYHTQQKDQSGILFSRKIGGPIYEVQVSVCSLFLPTTVTYSTVEIPSNNKAVILIRYLGTWWVQERITWFWVLGINENTIYLTNYIDMKKILLRKRRAWNHSQTKQTDPQTGRCLDDQLYNNLGFVSNEYVKSKLP